LAVAKIFPEEFLTVTFSVTCPVPAETPVTSPTISMRSGGISGEVKLQFATLQYAMFPR
jgi:hypothetical protein